jgi:integrase
LLPDDEEAPVNWDWVNETFDIGGTFILARGASPEQIMRAFGMNPAKARLVAASDVAQALHDPDCRARRRIHWSRSSDAGLPRIRLHDLRHSANSLMAAAGVPDHIRAAWCGHSTAINTSVYTHSRPEDLPVAAAALGAIMNAA